MNSNGRWERTALGEVLTLKRGYDLPERERRDGGVPIVSSSGFSGCHDTAKVKAPGVVTGRYGTIGEIFYVEQDFWPLNTTLYVEDFKGNDPRYCAELLRSVDFNAYNSKSGVPGVNRNDLHTAEVFVAPLTEQQQVAEIAATLDGKIDSNHRLAELIEQAAGTLFQGRFIDPSPLNSDDGDRPETTIGTLVSTHREQVTADSGMPYIGLNEMPRGSTILSEWLAEGAPEGQANRFAQGDILFGKLRPYFRKVGVAPINGRCSREILVLRPRDEHYWGFVLGHVASQAFIDHCVAVSRGTRMPRAEWKDASSFPVRVPPPETAEEHTEIVRDMYTKIRGLVMESRVLTGVRNALLPKLVSGEIRVPDTADPNEAISVITEKSAG